MLLRYLSLVDSRFASPFPTLLAYFWREEKASLGSCYLTGTPGRLQLSSGVISKIVSTASVHCTRPNQPDQRGNIRGQKRLHRAKAWCNFALYSLTGSARLVRSHNWTDFFVGFYSTLTRFDRGYASETCPGLVSTLLFPNLRPSSNSPSTYPPIGRLPIKRLPSPLLSIVYAVALGSYRPSLDSLSRTTNPTRHRATALTQRYTITLHCTAHNLRHCLLSLLRRILHPSS